MHTNLSTRTLFVALAGLVLLVGVYFLFSILTGHGLSGTAGNKVPPLTIEQKEAVLNSVSQMSSGNADLTPAEAAERQRIVENVTKSSSDSPAAQQSDAEKAKILESLQTQ